MAKTQQWQVSTHGVITSMDTKTTFVWGVASSTPCAHVTRNFNRYEWIIRADRETANTYYGTIMTNDCERNYWGINGTNVKPQSVAVGFTFTPVQPVWPQYYHWGNTLRREYRDAYLSYHS